MILMLGTNNTNPTEFKLCTDKSIGVLKVWSQVMYFDNFKLDYYTYNLRDRVTKWSNMSKVRWTIHNERLAISYNEMEQFEVLHIDLRKSTQKDKECDAILSLKSYRRINLYTFVVHTLGMIINNYTRGNVIDLKAIRQEWSGLYMVLDKHDILHITSDYWAALEMRDFES